VDVVRGQVAFAAGLGSDAPPLLLKAARRLEAFDLELARETYLTAWRAAGMAGHLAGAGVLVEICRAAQALRPTPGPPRAIDVLLDGLALLPLYLAQLSIATTWMGDFAGSASIVAETDSVAAAAPAMI
jgi:hypothetical protein